MQNQAGASFPLPPLEIQPKTFIFAAKSSMCTITLEYDKNSALARRKLALLLATGLFRQKDVTPSEPTPEQLQAHRELRDVVLENSKRSMSHFIARHI